MRWRRRKKTPGVIDIRGRRGAGGAGRGGGGGLTIPLPGGLGGGIGGLGLIGVLIFLAIQVLGGGGGGGFAIPDAFETGGPAPGAENPAPIPPGQDPQRELKEFSSFVFTDAQRTWEGVFRKEGEGYDDAQLVLYADAVSTGGCGSASSAVGPFYCPGDQRVYLDLSFYEDMERQLQAPGDFAWAYVIAHEMGHHIQRLSGTEAEVREEQRANREEQNELSVRLELQADCYAGVWASTVQNLLEPGDLEEAFTATEAIGDDRLQRQAGGTVDPDSFTHGSSEQRRRWFERGYERGDAGACDTFAPEQV
jgi:uncharacterized protein